LIGTSPLAGKTDQALICGTIFGLPEFGLILVKLLNLLCVVILERVELTAVHGALQMEQALGTVTTQMAMGILSKDNLPICSLLALLQLPDQKERC
jgi:hypothetical protein